MAVAGCVCDLNRGNFSAITKFIGMAFARPTRRPARTIFLQQSCLILPGPRRNRKEAQETAVALINLKSRRRTVSQVSPLVTENGEICDNPTGEAIIPRLYRAKSLIYLFIRSR